MVCPKCSGETPFEARREMRYVRCHHCQMILDREVDIRKGEKEEEEERRKANGTACVEFADCVGVEFALDKKMTETK